MGMVVRPARAGDGAAIGVVHVRSWQAAYRGVFPDAVLDGLDPVERGDVWEQRIATLDATRASVLVAKHDDVVAGFAGVGPSSGSEAGLGAVYSLYLAPEWWGRGVGCRLFAEAQAALVALGYSTAVLWVAEGNVRARRFYEAAGWFHDGAVQVDDSLGAPVTEVRYRSLLGSAR